MNNVIVADRLVKRIGDATILDALSFTVARGTVLGVLGPNGAGKTTAVKAVTGLITLDSGSVDILGHSVREEADAVKKRIGLAGQYAAVDGDLTAVENLTLVARLYGMSTREAKSRASELVEAFEMTPYAGKQVQHYSGGMRRRVDLACALIARPEVLILDEPTTGLDPTSRRALWHMIETLVEEGMTLLLTTQYLEEADRLADQVLVINAGQAIAEGTPGELKSRLGADRILITLTEPEEQQRPALAALAQLGVPHATIEPYTGRIEVRISAAARELPEIVSGFARSGIGLAGLSVHEPTLDDVFFALTEHSAAFTRKES
ncbi:ATP-binding cassette domain-containing protein [Pseudoclavibacter helvolus]|uniref:ATP-binding cassette domain-containing protein n=1 Tax=Pseudoclavibacter helvolus TaxID=255205 RepID=UPI00083821A2|nr:ATP-binding cassette domain-containing protein [Pseudoclavibacter helvolus]